MKFQLLVLYSGLLLMTLTLFTGITFLNFETAGRTFFHQSTNILIKFSNVIVSHALPPPRESVTLNDGVYTYYMNLSQHLVEFPYLQNYSCSIIHNPKRETETTKPLVVLAIKSHPRAGARRKALRQTWAREWKIDGYKVRTIFLVGQTDDFRYMDLVMVESREYEDILQWDFTEGHHNLSLKERCFLEWLYHHLPQVEFILKGDDDEYVNPHALVEFIKQHASSPSVLHGYLRPHSPVMRHSKYQISEALFPSNIFPTFLSGGGFVFPGMLVKRLYEISQKIPVFPLDDVYFGFLALAANLTCKHDARFYVYGLKFDSCLYQQALVVHGVEKEQLVQFWKEVQTAKC
ncbi:beta-1,3-galactosyltransferase 5-like [Mixophyes fleayi]|uniref:beta-1,3-galactosyltransferase 5-like n=1 Tax=Mixophyes fleayi TaxID=3061075 RepID=UPI003F4DE0CC